MKYPDLSGLYVERIESPARPHYAPDPRRIWAERDAYDAAVAEIWKRCQKEGVHGADVEAALRELVFGRQPANAKAEAIAQAALSTQKGNPSGFYAYFARQVDHSRSARYALYVMERGKRGKISTITWLTHSADEIINAAKAGVGLGGATECSHYIGVPDAVEAGGLTAELMQYGAATNNPDSPFDVGIYVVDRWGRKVSYNPMVWSGANGDYLRFPEEIRQELATKGISVAEKVSAEDILGRLSGLRKSRLHRGRFLGL